MAEERSTIGPIRRERSDSGGGDYGAKEYGGDDHNAFSRCVTKFEDLVATRPCCVATVSLLLALLFSVIGIASVLSSDADLFTSEQPSDVSHVTYKQSTALELARAAALPAEAVEVNETVAERTQNGDVLFMVYEAKNGLDLLTAGGIASMHKVYAKVTGSPVWDKFCMKPDMPGANCSAPLSPMSIFYASVQLTPTSIDYSVATRENYAGILTELERGMQANAGPLNGAAIARIKADANTKYPGQTADVDAIWGMYMTAFGIVTRFDGKGTAVQPDLPATIKFLKHIYAIPTLRRFIDFYFARGFEASGQSKYSRAIYRFGLPLPGYANRDDRASEQRDKFAKQFQDEWRQFLLDTAANDADVDVLYFATPLLGAEFQFIIIVDLSLAFFSMVFVFCYLWFQTESVIIAIAAMTEILLSLPLALFIFRDVLQFRFLAGLVGLALYIVLAIGADDVFVYVDAWKQALYEGSDVVHDLKSRVRYTYHRAASAMFITSFTTMCAFCATAISPLADVASFGIFSAMAILCDYILVITWMPAVVVLYHNKYEFRTAVCCCCCVSKDHVGCCEAQPQTSTAKRHDFWKSKSTRALELAPVGEPVVHRPVAVQAAAAVAGAGAANGGGGDGATVVSVNPASGAGNGAGNGAATPYIKPTNADEGREGIEKRALERFFEGPFADMIVNPRSRAAIVATFALLLIPILIGASSIKPSTSPDQFFPRDHPFQRIFDILGSGFPSSAEDRNAQVVFAWGPSTTDTEGVTPLVDPLFKGKVVYDPDFRFDAAAQAYLLQTCADFRREPATTVARSADNPLDGDVTCVVEDLAAWRKANATNAAAAWPIQGDDKAVAHAVDMWLNQPVNGSTRGPSYTYFAKWQDFIGVVDGRVSYVAVEVSATLPQRGFVAAPVLKENYERFSALADKVNAKAGKPKSAGTVIQTSDYWVWMRTQSIYVTSAVGGATFGAVLAFFVLLVATGNVVVAFLAMMTIANILCAVLALMVAAGWELGNIESICITILGGFSVDSVVHLAHSYMESSSTDRRERVRHALRHMGVSVLSGMVTSAGASIMLFFTTLQFFAKFGAFLLMTVTCSWLFANLLFLSLMATLGPEGGEVWLGLRKGPEQLEREARAKAAKGNTGAAVSA